MIQTIKSYILKALVAAMLLTPVVVPATASAANIDNNLCKGANLSVTDGGCEDGDPEGRVNGLITLIINIFSIVVGVVAVVMIIIGGLKYITSSGDSNNVTSAKNTILYAIIGLVVVALAQFIVKFVLAKAINADTTD
jgi:cytochrome bd-type quinol oxidase subunit 2